MNPQNVAPQGLMAQAKAQQSAKQGAQPGLGAMAAQGQFKAPAMADFTPADIKDAAERVVAAGMKIIYSPDMRDTLKQEIERDVPVAQKLAEAVVGLVLTLDQKAPNGIPEAVIAVASQQLLIEAMGILQASGLQVTEEDFHDASMLVFQMNGMKLGYTEEQLMGAAQAQVQGGPQGPEGAPEQPGAAQGMQQPMPQQGGMGV